MANLLVLHGPNLNCLGQREPDVYGATTLEDINTKCLAEATRLGHMLSAEQHNYEGGLVEAIQAAPGKGIDFIVLNPAAYTHTSVALRDALLAVDLPFIEVHLSNIYAREPFRHHSYCADIAIGQIVGFGAAGYSYAIQAAHDWLQHTRENR